MEIKHLTGEGLEQSALADSALSKEIDLYGLGGLLLVSTIL